MRTLQTSVDSSPAMGCIVSLGSPQSKETMRSALGSILALAWTGVGDPPSIHDFPWQQIDATNLGRLRGALLETYSPAHDLRPNLCNPGLGRGDTRPADTNDHGTRRHIDHGELRPGRSGGRTKEWRANTLPELTPGGVRCCKTFGSCKSPRAWAIPQSSQASGGRSRGMSGPDREGQKNRDGVEPQAGGSS